MAVFFLYTPLCYAASDSDAWEFMVAPYVWMVGIEGDATIRGEKTDVDISFSDILDNLDFGGMLHMEAKKGRFGFYVEPNYMNISADQDFGPRGNIKAEFSIEMLVIDFGGFYRVGQWGGERPAALDILLGGRYWNVSTEIDVDTPIPGLSVDRKSDRDLLDPVVGLRFQAYLGNGFQLSLRGDIGGFDISDNTSKLSWHAMGLLGYDVSKSSTIFAGYRALNINCEKDDNELDLTFHGPLVGMVFRF